MPSHVQQLMAKHELLLPYFLVILGLAALTCQATVYTVGDNSGWDISTDLDTWTQTKRFTVGDALSFQYSSYHSVNEVAKDSYLGCNTTNVLQSISTGNTTIPLNTAGDRYFVCGNKLHCLGGMKLQVHVQGSQTEAPASAPVAGGSIPTASSKNNNPNVISSSSAVFVRGGMDSLLLAFVGLVSTASTMFWVL